MLRLFTLGELRLETDEGYVLSRRRKPLVLLAYLARRAPSAVSRTELTSLLWGERAEERARHSLRQALLELKQLVGDGIEITHDAVCVDGSAIELDIAAFERDIEAGRDREAVARWTGGFLKDAESAGEMALDLWLETERAGLHRRLTFAFERLLEGAERRGARREGIAIARRWTQASPLDERACTHLISALRHDGHTLDALACHASFVARVKEELNRTPSREFLAMAQPLDESARAAQQRAGVVRELQPDILFVGREHAFALLTSAWQATRDGTSAAVLIHADHGMGATRLCDEFVRWLKETDSSAVVLRAVHVVAPQQSVRYSYAASVLSRLRTMPALGGLAESTLATLAQLLPRIRERFRHLPPVNGEPLATELAAAVGEALESIAEDTPVVVITDARRVVDAESRALLLQLAVGERTGVLHVVVAAPADMETDPGIAVLRAMPSTVLVQLGPLTAEHIAAMLESVSHLSGDDLARLARAILADTAGVPAYAALVIEALVDERLLPQVSTGSGAVPAVIDDRQLPTPGGVRAMVHARTRVLDDGASRVLEAGAVYGAPFTCSDAEKLTGLAPGAVARAVDVLASARLVRSSDSSGSYEVAPPVVARAVYALAPALQREVFHAAAAELLSRRVRAWRRWTGDRARIRYHRQQRGVAPAGWRSIAPWRLGVAAALLVGILVAASYPLWRAPAPRSRDRAVAIFPFTVSGGAQLAFLKNGMVDLLSTSLDGAAGLSTTDPRTVLAALDAAAGAPITPEAAQRIAERLGASYFILGSVVAGEGNLRLSATLYDMQSGAAVARASAAGSEIALFRLVDDLTAQLAVSQGAGSSDRLTRLAAATTSSLDALKAYLEGRNAYRSNDLLAAIPAFERAVAADSSFALAWYGLASAASWMLRPVLERRAAEQAVLNEGRLSARDRDLVQAFAAYARGAADSAERLTRSIVDVYSDDVEAWALLGEVLYHHNWKRGRSLTESRFAWERVLALDQKYWPALRHLSEVAALEGNGRQVDSLLGRYEQSVGAQNMPITSLALRAYTTGDAANRGAITARLAADRGFWLTLSIWYVAVAAQNIDDAQRLAGFLVDPVRPSAQQGFGRIVLAHLALAQGRWREARAQLAIARAHSPSTALQYQLLLSMAPFLATPAPEIERQRAELQQLQPAGNDESGAAPWPYALSSMRELTGPYVAGLASARRSDNEGRTASLAKLAKLRDPLSLRRGFASTIRAEQLRVNGQPAAALRELERGVLETPFVESWSSGLVSQQYERYTRAELLRQLGRDDEALRWYGTFGENSPYDLVYLAPALYRQGQIYEARGQKAQAARRYTRFLRLWKDADAELQPLVTDARTRLARLR